MIEKQRLHRKEAKQARRRKRKKERTVEEQEVRNGVYVSKVIFGQKQLLRLAEPLIQQSKQREIADNIVEVDEQPPVQ